jgi:hypothetical protein
LFINTHFNWNSAVKFAITLTSAAILLLFTINSCGDNPVAPEEHFEARGVILSMADTTTVHVDSGRVTGSLRLRVGEETTLGMLFITDEGKLAIPPADDDDISVQFAIADTTIATIVSSSRDTSSIRIRLRGKAVGITIATVAILHGGHDDFRTPAISVQVGQ